MSQFFLTKYLFREFFFLFLRIFWNAFWSSHKQNPSKNYFLLQFWWHFFCKCFRFFLRKKKCGKNVQIFSRLDRPKKSFFNTFQNIAHLLGQQKYLATFEQGGILHVGSKSNSNNGNITVNEFMKDFFLIDEFIHEHK